MFLSAGTATQPSQTQAELDNDADSDNDDVDEDELGPSQVIVAHVTPCITAITGSRTAIQN